MMRSTTIKRKREYLSSALKIKKEIKRKEDNLLTMRCSAGGSIIQATQGGEQVSNQDIIVALIDDIRQLNAELVIEQCIIKRFLEKQSLEDTEYNLLKLRYADCQPWKIVKRLLSYSETHIHRLENEILLKIVL